MNLRSWVFLTSLAIIGDEITRVGVWPSFKNMRGPYFLERAARDWILERADNEIESIIHVLFKSKRCNDIIKLKILLSRSFTITFKVISSN